MKWIALALVVIACRPADPRADLAACTAPADSIAACLVARGWPAGKAAVEQGARQADQRWRAER